MRMGKFLGISILTIAATSLSLCAANAGVYNFTLSGSGVSAQG